MRLPGARDLASLVVGGEVRSRQTGAKRAA
jgi:hypothetical protein